MNKLKPPPVVLSDDVPTPAIRRKTPPSMFKKGFVKISGVFGIFDKNQIVHQMPFILFVSVLLIGYISNSYYAERIIRDIDKTKSELKEKRAEYISTLSQLMYQSNQSEVARSLAPFQIKESTTPPEKIFITEALQKK
jgi:hypothetical protein